MINSATQESFIQQAVKNYSGMITRIAFQHTHSKLDAEDIMQDVFVLLINHMQKRPDFLNEEHLKHWLIRTSINKSRDYLRALKRKNTVPLDNGYALTEEDNQVFEELERLPEKERNVLYLFYYEGYSANEIAQILGKREGAIFMQLKRAREKLKIFLEE